LLLCSGSSMQQQCVQNRQNLTELN
jgi:hypothetical protein